MLRDYPAKELWKELLGERLRYKLIRGNGPSNGYVSVRIKNKAQSREMCSAWGMGCCFVWFTFCLC